MRLEHTQSIKQTQGVSLTPQMQQSLRLLQMSSVELTEFISQELLNNPFLMEETHEKKNDGPDQPYDRDPDLSVLQGQDYSNYWTDVPSKSSGEASRQEWFENLAPIPMSLRHHLVLQLHMSSPDPQIRSIGEALIDVMEEDGYIRADLRRFSELINQPLKKVLTVLELLQTFEPVGICAQTMIQCFEIQLKDLGLYSKEMALMLSHLDLVLQSGWEGLVKHCHLDRLSVEEMIKTIRTLNPKPGLTFDPEPIQVIIPDLFLCYNGQGDIWVELNEEAQPKILANQGYYQELNKAVRSKKDKEYIQSHYQQATWLERALRQRAETMIKVANRIVESQRAYFLGKEASLSPMTLKDLAQELNIHESTVSRATTHKFMITPKGTKELRDFFTHSIRGDDDLSAHRVQQRIRSLIGQEPVIKPLSDDQLMNKLHNEGIEVARRTVTKYREGMNIPSSYERKRQARLMTF